MTWYDRINGSPSHVNKPQNGYSGMQFMNPIQKVNYIRQALINPSEFVRHAIPNLPPDISNDPNQVLAYMKQNMGVTDMDIQNVMSQVPGSW